MDRDSVSAPLAYRKIMAAFDGSIGSSKALRRSLLIAKDAASELTVFSVDEHLPRYARAVGEVEEEPSLRDAYFDRLRNEALKIAGEYGVVVQIETRVGHAALSIVGGARDGGFDLVVIGRSGHSGIWGTLLGSTTDRVVGHATCDVLVVS